MTRPSRKGAAKSRKASGPSAQSICYTGPIKADWRTDDTVLATLGGNTGLNLILSVSGADTSNVVFNSVDVFGLPQFSRFAAVYQDYRVLGVRVEYEPKFAGAAIGTSADYAMYLSPLYMAPFHSDATVLADLGQASTNANVVARSVSTRRVQEVRMSDSDEAAFGPTTAAPPAEFGVKTFVAATSGVASTTLQLGTFNIYWLVQFRTLNYTDSSVVVAEVKEPVQQQRQPEVHRVPAPPTKRVAQWIVVPAAAAAAVPRSREGVG